MSTPGTNTATAPGVQGVNPSLSIYLDALRFGAAWLVVFDHARAHAFGPQKLVGWEPAAKALNLATSLGHAAVVVFFVVSGFLVGGKLYGAGRPNFLRRYLVDRASRIYTVAAPVLLLAFLAVAFCNVVFGQSFKLTSAICRPQPSDLVAALAFVHKGYGFNYCFISPIWSLLCEVFYYVVFGTMAVALASRSNLQRLLCAVAVVVLVAYSLNDVGDLWGYAPLWLLGAAIAAPRPLSRAGLPLIGGAIVLLGLAVVLRGGASRQDAVIAALVAGSVLFLRHRDIAFIASSRRLAAFCAWGASFSYSLYLIHAPTMNFIRTVFETRLGQHYGSAVLSPHSLTGWLIFVAAGGVAGWITYGLFERHTLRVRTWLNGLTAPTPASAAKSEPATP